MANLLFAAVFIFGLAANGGKQEKKVQVQAKPAEQVYTGETPAPAEAVQNPDPAPVDAAFVSAQNEKAVKSETSTNVSFGIAELGTADSRLLDLGNDTKAPMLEARRHAGS